MLLELFSFAHSACSPSGHFRCFGRFEFPQQHLITTWISYAFPVVSVVSMFPADLRRCQWPRIYVMSAGADGPALLLCPPVPVAPAYDVQVIISGYPPSSASSCSCCFGRFASTWHINLHNSSFSVVPVVSLSRLWTT